MAARIVELLVASLMPVLQLLIITGLGSFLAIEAVDILGIDARKHLNNVVFYVFSPALVGSNLAKYMTLKNVLLMWFMPLNILLTYIIGSVLGWILIRLTGPPRALRGLVIGCCSAGNLGNMLLVILPAVCREKGSPFGDVETCSALSLAYGSLSLAVAAIYMWSYVYYIMRFYATSTIPIVPKTDASLTDSLEAPTKPSTTEGCVGLELVPIASSLEHKEKVPFLERMKQGMPKLSTLFDLRVLLAPCTIAAMVGLAVGVIPHMQGLLIGDKAPLRVVQDSAALLGDAAIPTVTLVMGANLVKGLQGGSEMGPSVIIGVIVVRYIALPLSGIAVVKSAMRLGLVHKDPLYQFVLLLQYSVPPAMNIGTMSQLFGNGESECSMILLTSSALAAVAVTIWSAIFMWLVA
ncbi:Protein PIN-LIKES 3 [Linum perenne]